MVWVCLVFSCWNRHRGGENLFGGVLMSDVLIAALYKFVRIVDPSDLRRRLETLCEELGLRGTLLVAKEGLNGTLAGRPGSIESWLDFMRLDHRFADLQAKRSYASELPFRRLKVRLKKEIVSFGVPEADPTQAVGTYVKPDKWNALLQDPSLVLIDTRNHYETSIGTFKDAIKPETDSFRDFPAWFEQQNALQNTTKVAMFCTGGIRCEKATSYLRHKGVKEVYHLQGGILQYIKDVPSAESLWEGECFVFDQRVSVDHDLKPGRYDQCYACRRPIDEKMQRSQNYQKGVSCPQCYPSLSQDQKQRFTERQKQIDLARQRNRTT
jgi:UPF0176 protein